jgi:hypothetical protein
MLLIADIKVLSKLALKPYDSMAIATFVSLANVGYCRQICAYGYSSISLSQLHYFYQQVD